MKTELEILQKVKFIFDIQSDFSTKCNGYHALLRYIENLKNDKILKYKCERCGVIYEMKDDSIGVGCCVAPMEHRTSGICGGALTKVNE